MIAFSSYNKSKKMSLKMDVNSTPSPQIIPSVVRFKSARPYVVKSEKESTFVEESTIYKNETFNWVHYLLMYPDLIEANIHTCDQALMHWNLNGKNENRKTILNNDELEEYLYLYIHLKNLIQGKFLDKNMEINIINKYSVEDKCLFEKYPNLFHKYLLYLKDPNDKMSYKISKIVTINKKMICAIHCYDLNYLYEYFNDYFEVIGKYFSIVVTYCIENMDVIYSYDFVFLCIKNSGMDIGGKFICVNFLKNYNVNYDQIFFIHSKSDPEKRKKYIDPFISNMGKIITLLNKDDKVGGIFPNLFYFGRHDVTTLLTCENANGFNYGTNSNVVDEISSYFNIPNSLLFTEGNFYILNKEIANDLFGDLKIYNALNDENSFDYNWTKAFYFLEGSLIDVYSHFKKHNLFGNTNYYTMNASEKVMVRDYMIEHAFERIVIPCLLKRNKKIICANFENNSVDKLFKRFFNFINDLSLKNSYTFKKLLDYVNENIAGKFKYLDYIKLNNDLIQHLRSPEETLNHWLHYGIKENRIFNAEMLNVDYNDFLNMKFYNDLYNLKTTYFSETNFSYKKSDEICYTNLKVEQYIESMPKNQFHDLYMFNNFILVVDFPILGGGTTIFLNTIISKYKDNQTFLICRRYQDQNYFFINDDTLVERGVSDDECIQILNTWSFKITKIFINSTVGHKKIIIDAIFNLNKHSTIITHDHSSIYSEYQKYYHDQYFEEFCDSMIDYNKINCIVTQNEKNLSVYGKALSYNTDVIVSELPDYKKSCFKIETNNENIVIGLNGNISYIKGYLILKKFIERISQWGNVKLVIFGHCLDPGYPYQYRYNNINEFNALIQEHKPNFWLETSMWPETYSYTLTQMMLSQLPILYQKKNYPSVIESRLSKYSKAYSFDNVDNISYELISSLKQNYFYNIEPVIYYGTFWNNYFENSINLPFPSREKNVVFISSKIYTSDSTFTYSETRSIYSPIERFQQTLNTISSVRFKIPDSYIILFDNSEFSGEEFNKLNLLVDLFINVQTDPVINDYTNVKTTKAYGELAQTYATIKYIKTNLNYLNIKQFFKISGRYLMNETFSYSYYDNDFNVFKRNSNVTDRKYYYTSFYKISKSNLNNYYEAIIDIFNHSKISDNYYNVDWEVILAKQLNYNFIEIPNLGITQNISVWNQTDKV